VSTNTENIPHSLEEEEHEYEYELGICIMGNGDAGYEWRAICQLEIREDCIFQFPAIKKERSSLYVDRKTRKGMNS
jgi:hypothetical protein